jgi:hypothetical protein
MKTLMPEPGRLENRIRIPAGSFSGPNSSGSSPCELYDSRAVIPVNPKLNEHLNALDIHMLVEGKGRSQIT